jgi:hypothetical protein
MSLTSYRAAPPRVTNAEREALSMLIGVLDVEHQGPIVFGSMFEPFVYPFSCAMR